MFTKSLVEEFSWIYSSQPESRNSSDVYRQQIFLNRDIFIYNEILLSNKE